MKKIFIISVGYPYGKHEPFLQEEVAYFEDAILVSSFIGDTSIGDVKSVGEKNVLFHPESSFFRGDKFATILSAICAGFTRIFWKELFSKDIQPMNIRKILQLLSCISKAKNIVHAIEKNMKNVIEKNDEVIFYSYWMNQLALAAVILAKKHKGKAVTRCHGYDLYPRIENNGYVTLQRFLTSKMDHIYSISEDGKTTLLKLVSDKTLKNKISVSRLGTKDYGVSPGKNASSYFTIVSCSNLVPLKRVDLILQAITTISEFDIRWIHFGDGILFSEIQEEVERKKKECNHIIELRGYTKKEEIMSFYKENYVDLFVNVSESEGIPVSIMEALSFGIPCMGTNVGGVHEIINSSNGWLISPDIDILSLAESISKVYYLSESEISVYRKNARRFWENNYSAEVNYKRFVEELNSL